MDRGDNKRHSSIEEASLARLVVMFLLVAATCISIPRPAVCDDGAILAVGGSIKLMHEHPSIEMVGEFVHAWVSMDSVRVECVFFLKNSGPDATVTVGFPNTSGGADVDAITPFKSFESFVDGEKADVVELADDSPDYNTYGSYRSWLTRQVAFTANELHCIRDSYVADTGFATPDLRQFAYILETGASWHGPIGVADIVVTLQGINPDSLKYFSFGPKTRSGQDFLWHFENLEPDELSLVREISFAWSESSRR